MSAESKSAPCCADLAGTYAYLILRCWLGLRALLTGLEKYAGKVSEQQPLLDEFGEPDINGAMVEVSRKVYGFAHYDTCLGPTLIILGSTLLLGVAPRLTLFAQGLLYCSLSVGLILINESGGVAWLGIHVLLIVAALRYVNHDRFALLPRW
jgi:thiosulfate dehydrogenase (quinone) large subunit